MGSGFKLVAFIILMVVELYVVCDVVYYVRVHDELLLSNKVPGRWLLCKNHAVWIILPPLYPTSRDSQPHVYSGTS